MNTDVEVKKSRGRPQHLELGVKRTDPDYYKQYYSKQLASTVQCQHCNCNVVAVKLTRHYKTKKCMKQQKLNEIINHN
jgi:hypothetical protein